MKKQEYFIHSSSFVEKDAEIGKGTKVWHFCHIMSGARIGRNCKIGQNVVIHPTVVIGDNVKIQNNVSLYDGVILEDNVFCGPSCVFTNVINPRAEYPQNSCDLYLPTIVKKGVSIGANATVVCGITIGYYAFVGAGALVTKAVPDYALVYENPARIMGWICECGHKLKFRKSKAKCNNCTREYKKIRNKVTNISIK